MPVGLLGRKVGMTQIYDGDAMVPVTVIEAGPCTVLRTRTADRDGYEAVQLGFDDDLSQKDKARPEGERKRSRVSRADRGQVADLKSKRAARRKEGGVEAIAKANCEPKKFVKEFRTDGEDHGLEVGGEVNVGVFEDVKFVDVIGTSKGRGFAGVMKRHNFQGQGASHGAKRIHRHGGSIGQSADPARVLRGTRMAGQMGAKKSTVRHLKVVRVDAENNTLLVKGAVPGPNGGYVVVRHTNKTGR